MSGHRTFDYDYFKRLIREHPGWTHQEYARELTRYMREQTRNPKLPPIKPNTVTAVIARYRDTWLEEGVRVPPSQPARVLPWKGIPEAWRMELPLRRLRQLAQIEAGNDIGQPQHGYALRWARKMHESKQVVDLTPGGRPVVRGARPDELDGEGRLLSLYSRYPGLTESDWARMTPPERAAASAKWMVTEDERSRRHAG